MQQIEVKDTACVYLDQNNIYPIYKKIDFAKLRDYFDSLYTVIKATSFNSIDTKNSAQMKFVVYLSHNKWQSEILDLSISSNIDNILTYHLTNDSVLRDHNTIVLISGDAGFAYPLNQLKLKYGYKIHIVGCKDNTSIELLRIADEITYLENLEGIIL